MIVDVSKLKTVKNYSTKDGRSRFRIYQMIKEGKLESIEIDGVTFVRDNLPETKTEEK